MRSESTLSSDLSDTERYMPMPLMADTTLPTPVVTINEPLRDTAAVGANRTLIVQIAPTAREAGQVVDRKLKSVPASLPLRQGFIKERRQSRDLARVNR